VYRTGGVAKVVLFAMFCWVLKTAPKAVPPYR
jgi:hypothetical protein